MHSSINRILNTYYQTVLASIEDDTNAGVVDEFIINDDLTIASVQPRLLCQTRTIYFLCKYAQINNDEQALSQAKQLYCAAKTLYFSPTGWKRLPNDKKPTDNLYELAFVAYALTALYESSPDQKIADDAAQAFTVLIDIINKTNFFPDSIHYDGFVSQNPVMHLFESFIDGARVFSNKEYAATAQKLLNLIEQHFFDQQNGRIRECLQSHPTPWSEPGHSFEWVALLLAADKLPDSVCRIKASTFNTQQLLANVSESGVSTDGLVYAQQTPELVSTTEEFRIWPQLERVRALFVSHQSTQGQAALEIVLDRFFNEHNLPIEFIGSGQAFSKVKSTTGYHIINCFAEVLKSR